ncbi:MAG: sensor histidine kinase [Deltaproteobacteria bacterium]|nr:sensor histidine kinase [Deltaproteobacteria bacterium]MBW1870476.1 sensor histidine kinase [Deltaproteobacteria bacterium]
MAFLSIGLGILAIPRWAQYFGTEGQSAFIWYFVMIFYSVGSYLLIERGWVGKAATFTTLCFDLIVLVYMVSYSGGLKSPVLMSQLLYTIFYALLFPNPLAIVPPLLTLPVVAKIDTEIPGRILELEDIFMLIWYSAVNFIVVYVIVYLNEREDRQHNEVMALQDDLKHLAIVEERNRLSREIHDGLGASLSSLIIQAEYLYKQAKDEELKKEISELKSVAEESIDELRRSISMMRSDFDLVPTLEDYCMTAAQRTGVEISFKVNGSIPRLAGKLQLTTFRVLQEALNNIRKHAQAKNVEIELVHMHGVLHLVVKDDGVGFDYQDDLAGHYGLTNMRERARQYNGQLGIESAKGQGCKIYFMIPLTDPKTGESWRDTISDIPHQPDPEIL